MSNGSHHHRPSLKQSNKSFKTKHASKGSLKAAAKGRVEGSRSEAGQKHRSGQVATAAQLKANRRNTAKQLQSQKRATVAAQNKLTKGAEAKAPRIVAVIPLCEDVKAPSVIQALVQSGGFEDGDAYDSQSNRLQLSQPRSIIQFLTPVHGDLISAMDSVAIADFVVFAFSGARDVDASGEICLRTLASLGIGEGAVRGVVCNLPENPVAVQQVRRSLVSFISHFFPALDRIYSPSIPSESANLLRSLADKLPKSVTWRESRARLLAENVQWQPQPRETAQMQSSIASTSAVKLEDLGTLTVTGVIRGARISANRLVHIQGYGDFQMQSIIDASDDSHTVRKPKHPRRADGDAQMAEGYGGALSVPNADLADDLASTNVPSDGEDMLAEQTWPTEEEISAAPANSHRTFCTPLVDGQATASRLKKVPKGTSAYQAAWLLDDDDEEEEEDDEDEVDGIAEERDENLLDAPIAADEVSGQGGYYEEEEEYEYVDPDADRLAGASASLASTNGYPGSPVGKGVGHRDLPMDIEESQYKDYLDARNAERSREKEEKDDAEFPDEVDTPLDVPASQRFARYRGLKSFRTSAWDPYENLPRDYSRIYQFQNWRSMGKKLAQKAELDGVEPGHRVSLVLTRVPYTVALRHSKQHPLTIFGLLQHEHKYSVVHFTSIRNTEFDGDIRSKDPLMVQLGFRRFVINPLWSQNTQGNGGRGANNVHKFERYLRHGPTGAVGTTYLPITFGSNVPAILFQASASNSSDLNLVGTGSLLSVDPTRIVAKRIILTGHPYKVHKKTATIRYMFFNQPDVDYFKPVELRTKKGRIGHIRESLGTHGYFKAGFDGPIDQMDTICLNLYKRCYPKWGKLAILDNCSSSDGVVEEDSAGFSTTDSHML